MVGRWIASTQLPDAEQSLDVELGPKSRRHVVQTGSAGSIGDWARGDTSVRQSIQ